MLPKRNVPRTPTMALGVSVPRRPALSSHTRRGGPRTSTLPTRREFLSLVGAGATILALGGCESLLGEREERKPAVPRAAGTGRLGEHVLEAAPVGFALAGREVSTWGYGDGVPGPEIRAKEGDTLRVRLRNRLPDPTTVHWHGLAVPQSMDGVPGLSQSPVRGGEEFVYEFAVPSAGTYLYHSHVGLQLDRGLYGPLIVDPAQEPLSYDREYVVLLDDWLDGAPAAPEDALDDLGGSGAGMMGGRTMGGPVLEYPAFLVNGRPPEDPATMAARRGERVRLRIINAAAETLFRFAVAGHRLTVTHADGLPVEPVAVDCLRLGMGERYDALLEADAAGAWQIAALPEGKAGMGRAILRYAGSDATPAPPADHRPKELDGRLLAYTDLRANRDLPPEPADLSGRPDRVYELTLSGGMMSYEWAIDGQRYPDADPLELREGEWVRVKLRNRSMMAHPMHLHGHTFRLRNGTGRGPFKDTALVGAHGGETSFDFVADNPGEWFFHCHNAYHMETGMARAFSYSEEV